MTIKIEERIGYHQERLRNLKSIIDDFIEEHGEVRCDYLDDRVRMRCYHQGALDALLECKE